MESFGKAHGLAHGDGYTVSTNCTCAFAPMMHTVRAQVYYVKNQTRLLDSY